MRKKNIAGTKYLGNKVAAGSSLAVISIIFIISFFIIDSPATARNKTIDEAIINSMQSYEDSMNSYYQKNNSLPESLLDLNSSSYGYVSKDNKNEITYKKTGQYAYQLCANFKTSNLMSDKSDSYYLESYAEEWKHDKGSKCFDKEINQADRQLNDANH